MSELLQDAAEHVFKRIAPPTTPQGASRNNRAIRSVFAKFDRVSVAQLLAGLQTDGLFQANSIRLEWAVRLALIYARGKKRLSRSQLHRILNNELRRARITLLEDPIEDVLVEPVCTSYGEFLLFTGTWEKAGHHTENVISAFELLPEARAKTRGIQAAKAMLRLGDALVRRSGHRRYAVGEGMPYRQLEVPEKERLVELGRRVLFTWDELDGLGIDIEMISPFIFELHDIRAFGTQAPGNSDLEFQPLVTTDMGIVIAAPANFSTAIRAHLINVAMLGGVDRSFLRGLLAVQAKLVDDSTFARVRSPIAEFSDGFACEHIEEFSLGRFLHVLVVVDDLRNWPRNGFTYSGSVSDDFSKAISRSVEAAQQFSSAQSSFVSGLSIVLWAGWGAGRKMAVDFPAMNAWQVIFAEPHDAFVLGGCGDGNVRDIAWMYLQYRHVRAQGFDFQNMNGFLNLFQWWRNSDHAFVPPHLVDIRPPARMMFDSNSLLEARLEALLAWDRRSLPMPNGAYATVVRFHPKTIFEDLEAVYASCDAARAGVLVAVVLLDDYFPVWFELSNHMSDPNFHGAHETFNALLSWAVRVLPAALGGKLSKEWKPVVVRLAVEWPETLEQVSQQLNDSEIGAAIAIAIRRDAREGTIKLEPSWQLGLQRSDNRAEAALAGAVLQVVLELLGVKQDCDLVEYARSVLGGTDARWRHGIEPHQVVEVLKAEGLVSPLFPIPSSIAAFVKTGVAWATHPREDGAVIEGKDACRRFLDDQVRLLSVSLRAALRRFNREALVKAALNGMHSAQAEERQWKMSARALRAIHGAERDYAVSLERSTKINGVLRSSSILAELALVECPVSGGREVGSADLHELQAHALLWFQTADLVPAIEGGRIAARFNISPTGDVLHDHGFEETTLHRSAKITNEKQRDNAVRSYVREVEQDASATWDKEFGQVVASEYGAALEDVLLLAQRCAELAVAHGTGVLSIRKSVLVRELCKDYEAEKCMVVLIDRLTMHRRSSWEDIPNGATVRDFDIAKLDRRYSLVGRPILALDDSTDPVLVVAPGVVERTIIHNLTGARRGILQNEFWSSGAMQKFASRMGNQEGNRFNEVVADALRDLGLVAFHSVEPSWCFNHKKTDELKLLGDFDVLAHTPDGTRAWVVEAKDLKLCRTIGETARRLSEYEGRMLKSGKPDKMLRHLGRVNYARKHAQDLQKRLKLPNFPEIAGVMVVRSPQPMESVASSEFVDARVVMLASIRSVPWFEGWNRAFLHGD